MRRQVRVAGEWMNAIAPWGELAWATDERGCKDASWGAYFRPGVKHPALTRGALTEILYGPDVIWSGFLDEPNWAEGTFGAKGFAYDAENFMALDTSNVPTAVPSGAVDGAINNGWRVTRGAGIPTTAFSDTADGAQKVGALLDSSADELGQRWSVRADRVVRMETDPTAPTWVIRPGLVELGNASDEYASSIVVIYLNLSSVVSTVICTDAEAAARFDVVQYPLDLTSLGTMDAARATDYGNGILAKGKARLGWATSIEVTANDLLTAGGVPADLAIVRSGQLVRIYLGYDDVIALGGRTYLDVTIGSTSYVDDSEVLTIGPVNSVAQTLSEAISALTEEAARAA